MSEHWHTDAERGWQALSWEGAAQWFAKKNSRALGGRLRSLDALIGTIRNAEALAWDLYLNANPTRAVPGKKKLSREDVTHWRYVVVDLDPGGDALVPPHPGRSDIGPCCRPSGKPWPDSLLLNAHRIFSGRGYQYWLPVIDEQLEAGWQTAERIMRGMLGALAADADIWCPGWKVDQTCSDLARVVRCPGSVNQKSGRRSTFDHFSQQSVPVGELQHLAQLAPPPPAVASPVEGISNLTDLLPHLNIRARRFVLEGAESPGRHSACYATCKNMQELGVSASDARRWLVIGAMHCWETDYEVDYEVSVSKPLSEIAVARIVKQVYGTLG